MLAHLSVIHHAVSDWLTVGIAKQRHPAGITNNND